MRYSSQHRKVLSEAFDFLNGRDVLHLLLNMGAAEVRAGAVIGRGIHPYRSYSVGSEAVGALMGLALAAGQISIGMGLWVVAKMSSTLLARIRRPKYYPQERHRRERLAMERRRVRERFTTGAYPKPAELITQYAKARTSIREALKFGSMLCNLEAYCDNSLLRNADGEIVGRNPGVKGWIRDNCPELLMHYKNAMRYKGLAEKFRQAAGAADPVPAAALVESDGEAALRLLRGKQSRKITVQITKVNGPCGGRTVGGKFELKAGALKSALECAHEILDECERCLDDRLRCGTKKRRGEKTGKEDGRRGNGYGGVARLEAILDKRLGGRPQASFWPSRWRIAGVSADAGEDAIPTGRLTSA